MLKDVKDFVCKWYPSLKVKVPTAFLLHVTRYSIYWYSGFSENHNEEVLMEKGGKSILVGSSNHLRSKFLQSADLIMALGFSLCCCKDH